MTRHPFIDIPQQEELDAAEDARRGLVPAALVIALGTAAALVLGYYIGRWAVIGLMGGM